MPNAAEDEDRLAAIKRAYDCLTPAERKDIDRLCTRLRERVHGVGLQSALEIVAALGMLLRRMF